MGGALLNLVASGELNKIVNGNPQGWFRYAARKGHIEMVKYLVDLVRSYNG